MNTQNKTYEEMKEITRDLQFKNIEWQELDSPTSAVIIGKLPSGREEKYQIAEKNGKVGILHATRDDEESKWEFPEFAEANEQKLCIGVADAYAIYSKLAGWT